MGAVARSPQDRRAPEWLAYTAGAGRAEELDRGFAYERGRRRIVPARSEGEPFIALELSEGIEFPAFGIGLLTFDLREGTTIERAGEIAEMLNRSVVATALTK
jgi:hypothetical protein